MCLFKGIFNTKYCYHFGILLNILSTLTFISATIFQKETSCIGLSNVIIMRKAWKVFQDTSSLRVCGGSLCVERGAPRCTERYNIRQRLAWHRGGVYPHFCRWFGISNIKWYSVGTSILTRRQSKKMLSHLTKVLWFCIFLVCKLNFEIWRKSARFT